MNSKLLLKEYFALCPNGICDIGFLTEEEIKIKKNGATILTGILQSANKKNGNGRIYSREILSREDENFQKAIRERRSIGECDHPDSSDISLKNASHMILRTFWKGDDLYGVIKILSTPAGQILEGLIKDGVQLGISSRGLGSLKEGPQGAMVQEDFSLITYDIVNTPSTPNAFLIPESQARNYFSKADRINRLLREIVK